MAGLVDNGIAYRSRTAYAALARNYPCGYVLLGIEAVDHEAVAGIDRVNAAQVCDYNIALDDGVSVNHFGEQFGLLVIHFYTLLNIGHCKYFLGGHAAAADKKLFHKLIVAYSEVAEASETGSGIHEKSHEYPACGVQHLVNGEITAVNLIYSFHKVIELRETLFSAVIFVYDPCAARSDAAFALVLAGKLLALELAGVVVEPQSAALNERHVCENVIFCYRNKSVLNVFRVLESESVNDPCFVKQSAAGKSVEIRAGYQIHN